LRISIVSREKTRVKHGKDHRRDSLVCDLLFIDTEIA
jgi:hypothetical protein